MTLTLDFNKSQINVKISVSVSSSEVCISIIAISTSTDKLIAYFRISFEELICSRKSLNSFQKELLSMYMNMMTYLHRLSYLNKNYIINIISVINFVLVSKIVIFMTNLWKTKYIKFITDLVSWHALLANSQNALP